MSGSVGDYAVTAPSPDPFVHQELIEILYHTLWETVHVFFERSALNEGAGAASFLYPFLGRHARSSRRRSCRKWRLRSAPRRPLSNDSGTRLSAEQSGQIADAVSAIRDAVDAGGTVLCFGNGGSATDATDFALDLCDSPKGYARVPAISLASDAATLTAIANDIGSDALFSRQLIACGRRGDVAVAFSTSGGSANIVAALEEARSRGLLTIAIVGYDGGEVLRRRLADHVIVVNSDQIPRVQEAQASIYHVMLDLLEAVRRAHVIEARHFVVRGTVQGVGFRPFVARLAETHRLTGWVLNADRGVEIHVEGPRAAIDAFATCHSVASAAGRQCRGRRYREDGAGRVGSVSDP